MELTIGSVATGYRQILDLVLEHGTETSPRGKPTIEILCPTIELLCPTIDPLPIGIGRRANPAIGAVEALQLCAGVADPAMVLAASPAFKEFAEGGRFHGAYGYRISNQLEQQVQKLKDDPDTRQAVITLWDPILDNQPGHKDYPCTVALQLLLRNHHLIGRSVMRSNDAWRGIAYDLFQFGQLQATAANMLEVEVGPLYHQPGSLHMYLEDVPKVQDVKHTPDYGYETLSLWGFESPKHAWKVLAGGSVYPYSPTEIWYRDQVRKMVANMAKDGS